MPAKKPVVVLIHGMGEHSPGDMTGQFTTAMNAAMNKYTGFKTAKVENLADIVEINYNGFFDQMRTKMADAASPVADRLGSINVLSGLSWGSDLVLKLANIEKNFAKDEFLYTHFLDVVFYATVLGGKVRVDVARQLGTIIRQNSRADIHIVAHSLGTAVVHDTLALLYRKDADMNDDIPDLDLVTHRLSSIWMIANVSRLMCSITKLIDPGLSVVRPAPGGCVNYLNNVRHTLDPFTWFARVDPQNDDSWIPKKYFDLAYQAIETSVVRKLDTHDFAEYVEHPKVAVPLMRRLLGKAPKAQEIDSVIADHEKEGIRGAFDELSEALRDIQISDQATLAELARATKHFREVLGQFQEQLDAMGS